MIDGNAALNPSVQVIDLLFGRLGGGPPSPPVASSQVELPEEQPPQAIKSPADLQAACAWLEREKKRLEGYTQSQLSRLQAEHATVVQQNYRNEQALILRSQELGRTEALLASRTREFQVQLEAHEKERARLESRLIQLERRVQGAEQMEAAARRRQAEFDEMESRLHAEIEEQERRLADERRRLRLLPDAVQLG